MFLNKSIVVASVLFLSSCVNTKKPTRIYFISNDALEILNGNVKQITSTPADDIYSLNPGQDYDIDNLNKQGDINESINGFHGSVFKTYYVTEYDPNGHKLETKGYMKLSNGLGFKSDIIKPSLDTSKKLILIYKYNKRNEIVSYVVRPNKHDADSTTYKYDNNGNIIELDHYTDDKSLMDVTLYKYNKNNDPVEIDLFHGKRFMSKILFKYDKIDSNNNWTDATIHSEGAFYEGRSDYKWHRKITYY